jgi:hypothetical protein
MRTHKTIHPLSAQQVLMQQYTLQAQMYTQMYHTQCPYTFQAWLQMQSQTPLQQVSSHLTGLQRPVVRSTNPFDDF